MFNITCPWRRFAALCVAAIPCVAGALDIPEALQACAREHDDSQRLACYDREMARLISAQQQSFGLSEIQQRKLEAPPAKPKAEEAQSSVVKSLSLRVDGRYVIALANGETWVQGDAWARQPANVGDAVTIKPGLLGSFYLYASSGGLATRVTRQR
jgi:hypothetical protein